MKSDIRKKKLKVFGKTLLSSLVIAGGDALAIVFPSPIILTALGGAAMLIAGNNGVIGQCTDRKKSMEEVKNLGIEQSNCKWAMCMQRAIDECVQKMKDIRLLAYKDDLQIAVNNIGVALRAMEVLLEISHTNAANKSAQDIVRGMLDSDSNQDEEDI